MNEPKAPGRPPLYAGVPARVHVTVSPTEYDKAHQIAKRDGVSVPEVLRRGLTRVLSDDAE